MHFINSSGTGKCLEMLALRMGMTHYFPALQNEFGSGATRAAPTVTAGGSWDAADLKRAREEARARARGCGETGGATAVFRGGGAARRGLRGGCARARAREQARGAPSSPVPGRPAPAPTPTPVPQRRPVKRKTETHPCRPSCGSADDFWEVLETRP